MEQHWNNIHRTYREKEETIAQIFLKLLEETPYPEGFFENVRIQACQWGQILRQKKPDLFREVLQTYNLTSPQGMVLMQLAEALLRIPDKPTRLAFLREKMTQTDWGGGERSSHSWIMHGSKLALSLASWFFSRGLLVAWF